MSLLIVYHDKFRAVVSSDDRAISFNANGEPVALPERVCKFILVGGMIFACLGASDVTANLSRGFSRMIEDNPQLNVPQLSSILPLFLQRAFSNRRKDENRPMAFDNLESALIGFDDQTKRIRSYAFAAQDDFSPVETTSDPSNRIFALGHYGTSDRHVLERLTSSMRVADEKALPWIAAQLRSTLAELHEKYQVEVGQPSFYAAIDRNGIVELPADFPPAPAAAADALAAHLATTNKEQAFDGVTRFFLGSIMTPVAGGPDSIGFADGGPGAQIGMVNTFGLSSFRSTTSGLITVANPLNAIDGDLSTFCTLTLNAQTSPLSLIDLSWLDPPGITRKYSSIKVFVRMSIVSNTLNAAAVGQLSWFNNSTGASSLFDSETNWATGTPVAVATYSHALPAGTNISQIGVEAAMQTGAATTGTIVCRIYQVWVEAIE